MSTEIFTKEEFEAALPPQAVCYWFDITAEFTEYSYAIPVLPEGVDPKQGTEIVICSSIVRGQTHCGGTGENSIRVWIRDQTTMRPCAAKTQRWIARTKNWRANLLRVLRELYKIGLCLGPCPTCKSGRLFVATSGSEANPNRKYIGCSNRPRAAAEGCRYFKWLDAEVTDLGGGK